MGGACSRRLYSRHGERGRTVSLDEDDEDVQAGVVVRGAGVHPDPHQAQRGVFLTGAHSAYALRDGFVGPTNPSVGTRSLRVWSTARGGLVVDHGSSSSNSSSNESSPRGGVPMGCMSLRSSSSGRSDTSAGLSSTSASATSPGAAKEGFAGAVPQCALHGVLCPALRRASLQDMCVAVLGAQLRDAPEGAAREMLSLLTKDMTQRMLDSWIHSLSLTLPLLRSLGAATVEEVRLGSYPGVTDKWLVALRPQAETLLHVDLAQCSALTDAGLLQLLHARNMRSLTIDMCLQVSDDGLLVLQDCRDLVTFSSRGCPRITGAGISNLAAAAASLSVLDLERCPRVHGGLAHLSALRMLKVVNLGWCNSVDDSDAAVLASFPDLQVLNLSRTRVTNAGVSGLSGLTKLHTLALAGCRVTDAGLASLAGLHALTELDLSYCGNVTDTVMKHLRHLPELKVLNLAYTAFGDGHASMFSELRNLEELSLDSCAISDACLEHLAEIKSIRTLDLADTAVGNEGLEHVGRMWRLESLNLSFTSVADAGLQAIAGLPKLQVLNIDSRLITDRALATISTLTGLVELDVFGAKITDAGLQYLKGMKRLESLEVCGGGITDAGVRHLAPLTALTNLNLSQNLRISDAGLTSLSPLTNIQSLNLSGCRLTSAGLVPLRGLPCLQSLALHSCRVSRSAVARTLAHAACLWPQDVVVSGVK